MNVKPVKPMSFSKEWDTGDIWLCPVCERKYRLLHRDYTNRKKKYSHHLEEIKGDVT